MCSRVPVKLVQRIYEIILSIQIKDKKKALELEVKKLITILAMVREPEDTETLEVEEEDDLLK